MPHGTGWRENTRWGEGGGNRGGDLDNDGPEPLATVGQLSSPRFASFFEPPLYIYTAHARGGGGGRERRGKRSSSGAFRTAYAYALFSSATLCFASIHIFVYDPESLFSIAYRMPHKWFLDLLYYKFL